MDDIQLNNAPHLKPQTEARTCPQCGAPLLSEVCQYCGTYAGEVSTLDLASEYPTIECQLAKFTFFGTVFPFAFASMFLGIPTFMVVLSLMQDNNTDMPKSLYFFLLPFFMVGIGATVILIRNIWAVLSVAIKGKKLKGTIYGYMDDIMAFNGVNGQRVKILVYSSSGRKFIIVPLKNTNKPYPVNSNVQVRVYQDRARIIADKNYEW